MCFKQRQWTKSFIYYQTQFTRSLSLILQLWWKGSWQQPLKIILTCQLVGPDALPNWLNFWLELFCNVFCIFWACVYLWAFSVLLPKMQSTFKQPHFYKNRLQRLLGTCHLQTRQTGAKERSRLQSLFVGLFLFVSNKHRTKNICLVARGSK